MDSEDTIVVRVGSAIRLNAADLDNNEASVLVGTIIASAFWPQQMLNRTQAMGKTRTQYSSAILRREMNSRTIARLANEPDTIPPIHLHIIDVDLLACHCNLIHAAFGRVNRLTRLASCTSHAHRSAA